MSVGTIEKAVQKDKIIRKPAVKSFFPSLSSLNPWSEKINEKAKNLLLVQSKRWGFNYFSSMAKGLKKSIKGKLGSATKKALAYAKQNAGKALKQAMKVAKAKLPKNAK